MSMRFIVKERQVTDGRTTRIVLDEFESWEDAVEDVAERVTRLQRSGRVLVFTRHDGTKSCVNPDEPMDSINFSVISNRFGLGGF